MKFPICAIALMSLQAWGHGEDKPGPHGGVVRMPGAFHTEVVAKDAREIAVYLIDLEFKNPVVKDSYVKATLKRDTRNTALECVAKDEFFHCKIPKGWNLDRGELKVSAKRGPMKSSMEAVYALPLQFKPGSDSHHAH